MKNSNYRPSAINQRIHKVLACLDGYMNIALEQTEEYVNGQVSLPMDKQCWIIIRIEIKTSEDLSSISHFFLQLKNKYGDAFIRGNNVLYISTVRRR